MLVAELEFKIIADTSFDEAEKEAFTRPGAGCAAH